MGIEESFERIAMSLEKSVAIWQELLEISRWNKARLEAGSSVRPPASAPVAPESAPPAAELDYDALKAALKDRGISVPKGTKMTTLQKLWAVHKDDPKVAAAPAAPETVSPAPESAPESELKSAVADDDLMDDAPAEAEKKPMTKDKAIAILSENYAGTPEDKQLLFAAFATVGATKFSEVKAGDYEKVINAFREMKAKSGGEE